MQSISLWAAKHKNAGLLISILLHLLNIFLGVFLGYFLYKKNIFIGNMFYIPVLLLFLTGIAIYPFGKNFKYKFILKKNYVRQKIADFILAFGLFLFVTAGWNQIEAGNKQLYPFLNKTNAVEKINSHQLASVGTEEQETANQQKMFDVSNSVPTFGDFLKITFLILFDLALILLISLFSCSLACQGYVTLSVLFLIASGFALFLFSDFFIRTVISKQRNLKKGTKIFHFISFSIISLIGIYASIVLYQEDMISFVSALAATLIFLGLTFHSLQLLKDKKTNTNNLEKEETQTNQNKEKTENIENKNEK